MGSATVRHRCGCVPRLVFGLALLLGTLPGVALAQDGEASSANRVADGVALVATGALVAEELPADNQTPPDVAAVRVTAPEGFLSEPRIINRAIRLVNNRALGKGGRLSNGFYPEYSNMVTGSGWISAGPGYRHWFFGDRAIVDASSAISWRSYKTAQARLEFTNLAHSRLAIGSQVMWQDLMQVTFFGEGPGSREADRSEYRMQSTDIVGYTVWRPAQWLAIGGRLGWLQRPTIMSQAGTFERGNPDTRTVFSNDVVYALPEQPDYLHSDVSITADTRDVRSHPSSGGVYRAASSVYADRHDGAFNFRRYEAEAAQFIPLAGRRVVLALHGWIVGTEADADGLVPFYLMPSLGGGNTLRGYTDYRFHDRNLVVVNAESRFAVMTHVDLAAFVDAGNVAPRISGLNLHKTSYGIGLRMHTDRATFGRLEMAHSADGWRLVFKTSDPFHLSRLTRRTATAPFVP